MAKVTEGITVTLNHEDITKAIRRNWRRWVEPKYPFGKMVRGTISGDLAMCIGMEPDGDICIIPVTGERAGTIQSVPDARWDPV